ncbi:MAG: N-acetylglucosamine-6-phosphate deacetylase, partial [Planctomycetota bacterium]
PGGIATRHLVDSGVVVSAGHSEARLADLDIAIEQGLSMFTHLGNGCPCDIKRHDNTITRVLSRADALKISFIADGHHIPWFALRQYLSLVPESNIVIVSDAMQAAGVGPGTYRLADQTVIVDPDQSAWSEDRSHFAGSATTLPMMMRLLIEQQMGTPMQVERWCYRNPGALLSRSTGRIEDAPAG